MSLRGMASCDLGRILCDSDGLGEAIVYTDADGNVYDLTALWVERPTDVNDPIGIGVESVRSMATCRINVDDIETIDMRSTITRTATAQDWVIEQARLSTGICWILTLARANEAQPRDFR